MDSNNPSNGNANHIAGAITYPSRSNNDVQRIPIQPRQPRNLQGLLRFAMEATKAEDAPGNSELGPMDEERRRFLNEALRSMTVDVVEVLQESIKVLTDSEKIHSFQSGESLPEYVQLAFDNLLEIIDDIDVANDFYKMGGFAIFPVCYGSDNEEIRARASFVLGELCQNNPFCQQRAMECGLLNILLSLVRTEQGNALTKSLYALSCVCRDNEPAIRELVAQGGCSAVARLVGSSDPATRTKAAFFIRYLCRRHNDVKEIFIEEGLVTLIADYVSTGRDETTEHLLGTLLALIDEADPRVLQQCRNPSINLRKTLEEHLTHPDFKDERYTEEKEYCQEILTKVFDYSPQRDYPDEEPADR